MESNRFFHFFELDYSNHQDAHIMSQFLYSPYPNLETISEVTELDRSPGPSACDWHCEQKLKNQRDREGRKRFSFHQLFFRVEPASLCNYFPFIRSRHHHILFYVFPTITQVGFLLSRILFSFVQYTSELSVEPQF